MKSRAYFESYIRHQSIRSEPRIFEKINFISFIKFNGFSYFTGVCLLLNSFSIDFNLRPKCIAFNNFIKLFFFHYRLHFLFFQLYSFFLNFQKFYCLTLIYFIFVLIDLIKQLLFLLFLLNNSSLLSFQPINLFLIFEI